MKDNPGTSRRSFSQRTSNFFRPLLGLGAGMAALLLTLGASAGSFVADFNSGLPAGAAVYGNATVDTTGGVTNSGCLKLTTAANSQQGSFIVTNDLDAGGYMVGLVARFQAYVGGGSGADGFSFNFAPDLPANGGFAEEGAGSGLTVSFDTYSNDFDVVGIELKGSGSPIASWTAVNLRAGTWVDVLVQLHPDGNIDVMYDGNWVFTNQYSGVPIPMTGGRIGFGARTGGANDNHWIDNLSITTVVDTNAAAYVDYCYPTGRRVRADAPIYIELSDYYNYYTAVNSQVNPNSIVLQVDGATVSPTMTTSGSKTAVHYVPPVILPSGSPHTVSLSFADTATPTPHTTTWTWGFTVDTYKTLDTNLVVAPALVSANRGFALRVSQIDANRGPTIQRAENQLAGLLLDPATGQPYLNRATLSATNEPCVINYSTAGAQGNFPTELPASIPGLPGALPDGSSAGDTNAALEAVTYLYLNPGVYTLGVNSSDGFRLTTASTPDLFASQLAVYEGVRAAADSTVTFGVTQAGYYPFRICYFIGGQEVVYPTADVPSLEFFSADSSGTKTLINDTNTSGALGAFLPAQTLPYVRTIAPSAGETGVAKNAPIDVTLINGTITVQTDSIQLLVNGTAVTPTVTQGTGGTVTVHYQRPTTWPLNSTNTVQLAFTDSAANRRTNSWQFTTENILTQLWVIPPASTANATWAKWVTSGGTERGLAYNPKTGHVLLISRNSATGTDGPNGCGVAILDGNDGHYIGQLNLTLPDSTTIRANGLGTFKLDMIDVAEDGVIYAGNLTTSGTVPFIIYRWQNESASPTIAYSGNPADLTQATRCGDDFAVRGSGAGTQIIASGNSTVTNVPLFTTIDGTNFTGTCLKVTGLPAPTGGAVRLGLAWGCGNTFYGETTGANNPVRQITFAGPGSTVANLVASYTIVDAVGSQTIGPIGVDVLSQRLIGDATLGTGGSSHSMNLFDLNALAVTPAVNNPIDSKPFAVSVGTFGTGAIDFTPDGARVYTLDSGSGIIAFSLAPKLAVPAICAQPQTNYVASLGAVGFMDVMAIGAPQSYQWRFNGANLSGATNRTLDLYNVQPSQLGLYSVVITNALGSVTSAVAVLDTRMVITSQPASQRVDAGTAATFTVGLSNGLAPFVYQWQLNGTNLPNGTASSLTLNNAQVADGGSYTVTITDSLGQAITSQPAVLIVGSVGTGAGLTADYYAVSPYTTATPTNPFAGYPYLSRIDATVDFDWGTGSPDLNYITADYFTARWHGQVQPFYSQVHTFYTRTDDGVRLWVNGQLLIDQWVAQAPTEKSGPIALNAGQKYDILMEYYEKAGGAVAQLSWSSPSLPKAIIPMTQLYTNSGPFRPGLTSSLISGTNVILNWTGTCTVESATNVAGPWTPMATDIVGPYTNSIGAEPQMYFRLLSQQSLY